MRKYLSTLIPILFFWANPLPSVRSAPTETPKREPIELISVHDGDTFNAKYQSREIRIRLACVDAPELKQPLGKPSKAALEKFLSGGGLSIEIVGTSYDRQVANVYSGDRSAAIHLADLGMAYPTTTYKSSCKTDWPGILEASRAAKILKLGVYKFGNDVPPWEFRKQENIKSWIAGIS
jgi:micrococcal nuclease